MPYPLKTLFDDVAKIQHSNLDLFGSGRLIGRNLVLTARHVITVEGSPAGVVQHDWQVRLFADRPDPPGTKKWPWIKARVVWMGQDSLDLALLELLPVDDASDRNARLRLRIAKIDRDERHSVQGLGFPRGAIEDEKRNLVPLPGNLDEGEILFFAVDPAYRPETAEDWRGFSGAPILLKESPDPEVVWIYGVAQQVPSTFKNLINVARLAAAYEDKGFLETLKVHDVSLEPPSDPTTPSSSEQDSTNLRDGNSLDWEALYKRALSQIVLERESLRAKLRLSPDAAGDGTPVQSNLLKSWQNFIGSQTWKESCLEGIGRLRAELEQFDSYTESKDIDNLLRELAGKLHPRETYIVLRSRFAEPLSHRLVLSLNSLRKKVLAATYDSEIARKDAIDEISGLQRRTAEFLRLGQKDVFRKCFLVMGGVGSGKTHFVTDLLADHTEEAAASPAYHWLPICLQHPSRAADLGELLLRTIRSLTRVDWLTLGQFFGFVSSRQPDAKVVVMIDDLHKWIDADPSIVKELALCIKNCTRFDQLHWLIFINDRAYASIAPATKDVWAAYCDAEPNQFLQVEKAGSLFWRSAPLPRSGGWYRLDEIVEEQELGLRLLENAATERNSSLPESVDEPEQAGLPAGEWDLDKIQEMAPEVRRELSNPLIATVLAIFVKNSALNLKSLVDARFVDFVLRLKELLIERSLSEWGTSSGDEQKLILEQAIDYIAWAFASTDRTEQPIQQLQNRILEIAKESQLTREDILVAALRTIDRAHLIDIFERQAAGEITRIRWVGLRLELFWEFHLAQQRRAMLFQPDTPNAAEALLQWVRGSQSKRLVDGVAQFLLVLLDADGGETADHLWLQSFTGNGFPLHTALFAASRALLPRQTKISAELQAGRVFPQTPDDLLALVSFANLAAKDAATIPQRVAMLHPHFGALGEAGLGDYCAFALSHLITQVEKMGVMQKILPWLEGSELLGTADKLADLCVRRIMQIVGEHHVGELVDSILAYARHPRKFTPDYEQDVYGKLKASQLKGRDRYLFRHWVFDRASYEVTTEKRGDTYDFLWKRKWYGAERVGVDMRVASELEKFANFSIGDSSQHSEELRRKLILLVHDLVESKDPHQRENAYYLIRHSEPIPLPGVAVIVSEEFWDDLRKIARDSRLLHLRQRPESLNFLKANLGDDFPIPPADTGQAGKRSRQHGHRNSTRH